ncbi:MAG: VanZ family protein [Proteobacteria bacterium]|nr:VanZ family protein [Pseudomonadota bacterium]
MPAAPNLLTHGRAAALGAGGLAVLAVVLFGRLPGQGRWASDLSNAAHGPAFALVTLVVFALLRRPSAQKLSIFGEYSIAILLSILLGALIEVLQHFTGRDAALIDLWTDTIGTMAVAGGLLAFDRRVQATGRRAGFFVSFAACILMLAPLLVTAAAYVKRQRDFPTLVEFRLPLATSFIRAGVSATVERSELPRELRSAERESIGVRAHLTEKTGWALVLSEPVADWRG